LRTALREPGPLTYVEMGVGLGVLIGIDLVFFRGDPAFGGANPHPFWFVVVLIAVRYGALPGYFVGALSALAYLTLVVLQAGSLSQADLFSVQVLLNPVLFLLIGAVIGEVREAQKRAYTELTAKYGEVEAGVQDLAQRYLASMEISRELERRIEGQTSTVMTLYKAAKSLENMEMQTLSPSLLELTASFVEAEACALYLRRNGGFVLEAGRPANVDFDRPHELDTARGMLGIVLGERRTATVRDVIVEATPGEILGHNPLMATPLLSEDGEVIGVLVVERMPFLRFTPTAVKLFALLGDWASSAFQRALSFQQTRDRNIEDEVSGAYNYFYLLKRLGEEIERSRRYGMPLTIMAISINDYEKIPPVKATGVLRMLSLSFRRQTRAWDILGKYPVDGIFLLVLLHTTTHAAQTVAKRLQREFEAFDLKAFDDERGLEIQIGIASPSESVTEAESLVEEAVRDLPEETSGVR
jgi:diguanylate cyclase (GGDEF)-like protein